MEPELFKSIEDSKKKVDSSKRKTTSLGTLVCNSPPPLKGDTSELKDELKAKSDDEKDEHLHLCIKGVPTLDDLIELSCQIKNGSIHFNDHEQVLGSFLIGTAAQLSTALQFVGSYSGTIKVKNQSPPANMETYIEALITINKAAANNIKFTTADSRLRSTSRKLCAALRKVNKYKGQIIVTDQPTVAQLVCIQSASAGEIILENKSGAIKGTSKNLILALKRIEKYQGQVTITDKPSTVQLKNIQSRCLTPVALEQKTQYDITQKKEEVEEKLAEFTQIYRSIKTALKIISRQQDG